MSNTKEYVEAWEQAKQGTDDLFPIGYFNREEFYTFVKQAFEGDTKGEKSKLARAIWIVGCKEANLNNSQTSAFSGFADDTIESFDEFMKLFKSDITAKTFVESDAFQEVKDDVRFIIDTWNVMNPNDKIEMPGENANTAFSYKDIVVWHTDPPAKAEPKKSEFQIEQENKRLAFISEKEEQAEKLSEYVSLLLKFKYKFQEEVATYKIKKKYSKNFNDELPENVQNAFERISNLEINQDPFDISEELKRDVEQAGIDLPKEFEALFLEGGKRGYSLIDELHRVSAAATEKKDDSERIIEGHKAIEYVNSLNHIKSEAKFQLDLAKDYKKFLQSDSKEYRDLINAITKVYSLNENYSVIQIREAMAELNIASKNYIFKLSLTGGGKHTNGAQRYYIADAIRENVIDANKFLADPLPDFDITLPIGRVAMYAARTDVMKHAFEDEDDYYATTELVIASKEEKKNRFTSRMTLEEFKLGIYKKGWVDSNEVTAFERLYNKVKEFEDPELDKLLENLTTENAWAPADHIDCGRKLLSELKRLGYPDLCDLIKKDISLNSISASEQIESAQELSENNDIQIKPEFLNPREKFTDKALSGWENIDKDGNVILPEKSKQLKTTYNYSTDSEGKKVLWDDPKVALYKQFIDEYTNAGYLEDRGDFDELTFRLKEHIFKSEADLEDDWQYMVNGTATVHDLTKLSNRFAREEDCSDAVDVLRGIKRAWENLANNLPGEGEDHDLLKRFYEDSAFFADPDAGNYMKALMSSPYIELFRTMHNQAPTITSVNVNIGETIAGMRGNSPLQADLPSHLKVDAFKTVMDVMHAGADEMRVEYLHQDLEREGAWNGEKEKTYKEALVNSHRQMINCFEKLVSLPDAGQYDSFMENTIGHIVGRSKSDNRDVFSQIGVLKGEIKAFENGWNTNDKIVMGVIGGLEAAIEKRKNAIIYEKESQNEFNLLLSYEKSFREFKKSVWDKKVESSAEKRQVLHELVDFVNTYKDRKELKNLFTTYNRYKSDLKDLAINNFQLVDAKTAAENRLKYVTEQEAQRKERPKTNEELRREKAINDRKELFEKDLQDISAIHNGGAVADQRELEAFTVTLEKNGWCAGNINGPKEIAKLLASLKASLRYEEYREKSFGIKQDEKLKEKMQELITLTSSICDDLKATSFYSFDGCKAYMDIMVQKLMPYAGVVYSANTTIDNIKKAAEATLNAEVQRLYEERKKSLPKIDIAEVRKMRDSVAGLAALVDAAKVDDKSLNGISRQLNGLTEELLKKGNELDPEYYDRFILAVKAANMCAKDVINDPKLSKDTKARNFYKAIRETFDIFAVKKRAELASAKEIVSELASAKEAEMIKLINEITEPDLLVIRNNRLVKTYTDEKKYFLLDIYTRLGVAQVNGAYRIGKNEVGEKERQEFFNAAKFQSLITGKLREKQVVIGETDVDTFVMDIQQKTYMACRSSIALKAIDDKNIKTEDGISEVEASISEGFKIIPDDMKNLYNELSLTKANALEALKKADKTLKATKEYVKRMELGLDTIRYKLDDIKKLEKDSPKDFADIKKALDDVLKLDSSKKPAEVMQEFTKLKTALENYLGVNNPAKPKVFKGKKNQKFGRFASDILTLCNGAIQGLTLDPANKSIEGIKANESLRSQLETAQKNYDEAKQKSDKKESDINALDEQLKKQLKDKKSHEHILDIKNQIQLEDLNKASKSVNKAPVGLKRSGSFLQKSKNDSNIVKEVPDFPHL